MRDEFRVFVLKQSLAKTDAFVHLFSLAAKKQSSSSPLAAERVTFAERRCHAQMSRSTDATYNLICLL